MAQPVEAQYGTWQSPITAGRIAGEAITLRQIALDGDDVYWCEQRPSEGGRAVIVRRRPDGTVHDITPSPFYVRTRVHEYGGGDYLVDSSVVIFANFEDQRLYRQQVPSEMPSENGQREEPVPLTPSSTDLRYADFAIDQPHNRLFAVREDHRTGDREAVNAIVSLSLSPANAEDNEGDVLVSGNDFYADPRLSPDGEYLCWLTWNHPNMPWDGTELWVAAMTEDGSLDAPERIAGGTDESIFQPRWSPDGTLYFVSDRTGWWNLYRTQARVPQGQVEAVTEEEAEFGVPQWVFGRSTYAFAADDRIVAAYSQEGIWRLATIDTGSLQITPVDLPFTDIAQVRATPEGAPGTVTFVGGSPTRDLAVVHLTLADGQIEILRRSTRTEVDERYLSEPRTLSYPTTGTARGHTTAHAFYYPPRNGDFSPPPEEKPPLIVICHGGPTGANTNTLDLAIQFWTSRGIAVLDVNYGGSTGYGRAYRRSLYGLWGIVDLDDCVNGARYLVDQGAADPDRLIIRGGSAGGYTTLAALTFRDAFQAGASYFGVSDLAALARDTHKFESRYLDRLIGPYPDDEETYQARSPILHTDQLNCPIIFFQGLEDRVVPPDQAETMVEAMQNKGLPVAYLSFEGEQHGFRQEANVKRCLEAELYFYGRIFGFTPADEIEPVPIENM